MVSTCPPTSKSSSLFKNSLVTVPKAPSTIVIIVTFVFHSFCNSQARLMYLYYFWHYFNCLLRSAGTAKSTILQILFFFCCCCWLFFGLVFRPRLGDPYFCQSSIGVYVWNFLGEMLGCASTICLYGQIKISWSVCTSKSERSLCVSFHKTDPRLYIWWNSNFLHNSLWIPLPTLTYLFLYSFCANLQHSLIMRLMVSSLSPHNLHLLFRCVLSILVLMWVFMVIYLLIYSFESFFHKSISWWFLTSVWLPASLLKSQGLFSVFSPILVMR